VSAVQEKSQNKKDAPEIAKRLDCVRFSDAFGRTKPYEHQPFCRAQKAALKPPQSRRFATTDH
jgi:hypothetical protein